jgi:NAD(P)-dependent dehydrogenase (short-subunit alcohol dehydrogenase family)
MPLEKYSSETAPIYPDMRGKIALITGGSRGIGFATARSFARQGARVVIASRDKRRGMEAMKLLAKDGDVQWLAADVADGKSVKKLFDGVIRMHQRLDYAFNNGGSGGHGAAVGHTTEEAWRATIDGFLTSTFLCMSAEIRAMQKTGVIVNNASVDGLRGYPVPGGAAYSAAKHGVVGLTRSAALEYAASGPRICAICPGWVATAPVLNWMKRDKAMAAAIVRQTPRGRIGDPDEIAAAVLWLCSGAAAFAVGTIMAVDGGYMA